MASALFNRMDLLTCFVFLLVLGLSQRFQLLPSVPSPEEFLSDTMIHQSGVSVADESSRGPRRRLLEAPSQAEDREAQRQMVRAAVERWRKEQRARDKREMNESMPNTQPPKGERFLLGPKITDWDEQRADYVRKHPGSNETRQGKARVMLVTGSQPGVCDNDVGDFLLLKSLKNKLDYCSPRDIEIYYSTAILDRSMDSFWVKLPLLRKLMLSHAEVEWFWWMDSDAVFTDMTFDVPFEKYEPHVHMVMHGYDSLVYGKKDWVGLNAGIYLIRNSQWSLDFMEDLAQFGVKGPMRDAAGVKLFKELSTRPMFEGDDQSAIVWMMAYHPEKYAKGIYLESSFMLHSFWPTITPHYEELMDKYHPGYGDHRWPLITHFVGCKPCGKIGQIEYEETQRCVENMERAFNFADNQVLRKFGYEHLHLDTFQVVKINFTTYKASEFDSHPLKNRQLDF
ncbi:unnamed protein product [Closterium sp. Naga37s-1]|nr:unnamed protein product [Closterium sp. Naga37s-1]